MSAHTPGPWKVRHGPTTKPDGKAFEVRNDNDCLVCLCGFTATNEPIFRETAAANARLIATAPELLAALKELVERTQSDIEYNLTIAQKKRGKIKH